MKTTNRIRFFSIFLIFLCILGSFFLRGSGESLEEIKETVPTELPTEQIAETEIRTETAPVWSRELPKDTTPYLVIEKDLYLSVYSSAENEKIFDTGILVSGLEEELQKKVKEGILFSSIEEVYDFLENCSS